MAGGVSGVLEDITAVQKFFKRDEQREFEKGVGDLSQLTLPDALAKAREADELGLDTPSILLDQIDYLQQSELQGQSRQAQREYEQEIWERGAAARDREVQQQRETNIAGLLDDMRPDIRQAAGQAASLRGMGQAEEGFAGDQQLAFGFMKQLQPTGPITDDDINRVSGDPSISASLRRALGSYVEGRVLTAKDRLALLKGSVNQYKQNRMASNAVLMPALKTAARFQVDAGELLDPSTFVMDDELGGYLQAFEQAASEGGGDVIVPPPGTGGATATPETIDGQRVYSIDEYMQMRAQQNATN